MMPQTSPAAIKAGIRKNMRSMFLKQTLPSPDVIEDSLDGIANFSDQSQKELQGCDYNKKKREENEGIGEKNCAE